MELKAETMVMGYIAVLFLGYPYQIGRAMDLITWQWEPDHCRIVAGVGLTDEDRNAVNRIAAQEGVDPEELEEALVATSIRFTIQSVKEPQPEKQS